MIGKISQEIKANQDEAKVIKRAIEDQEQMVYNLVAEAYKQSIRNNLVELKDRLQNEYCIDLT